MPKRVAIVWQQLRIQTTTATAVMFRSYFTCLPVIRRISHYTPLHPRYISSGFESDGTIPGKASFSHQWLRDSCQCPSCVHPSTLQKLHRSSDITVDVRPTPGGLTATSDGIHIRWTDGHESFYQTTFLERYSSPSELTKFHRDIEQVPWNASLISQSSNLYIPYEELVEPSRLLRAINQLIQYGLLFVTGVPNDQTSNEACELRKLAKIFGELRATFYGETWDVKNVRNSRNIAYTNLDLGLHMDLLYVRSPSSDETTQTLEQVLSTSTAIPDSTLLAQSCRRRHLDFCGRALCRFVVANIASSGI